MQQDTRITCVIESGEARNRRHGSVRGGHFACIRDGVYSLNPVQPEFHDSTRDLTPIQCPCFLSPASDSIEFHFDAISVMVR